jgi:hypothetical protein
MEDKMKNKLWILALVGITFTGCYTSFAPRDYEAENYGNLEDAYYDSEDYVTNYDSLDYVDEDYYYEDPQDITIINNYPTNYGWDLYSPVYVTGHYDYWGTYYNLLYDPYCDPYYSPYYRPYYGSYNYWGSYSGAYYSKNYYPSEVRYRNTSHWTSLRNNGGRTSVTRSRDIRNNSQDDLANRNISNREVRGFDLDRELRVTRSSGSSTVSKTSNNGLRTASIRKNGDVRTARKKTTDLERRRISTKTHGRELSDVNTQSREKRQAVKKNDNSNSSSQNRSKRVYSSNRNSNSGVKSYHRASKPSERSINVAKSSRRNTSNSSPSYKSSPSKPRTSSVSRTSTPSRSSSVSNSTSSSSRSSSSGSRSSSKSSSRGRR